MTASTEKRPSFILRDIDPALWRKVKAKAALEGATVKAVILKLLAKWVSCIVAMLAVGCAYQAPPTAPTIIPPVVVVETPQPVLPEPRPVTLHLASSPQQTFIGEGVSLIARPLSGDVTAPASYGWIFGDGASETTSTNSTGHVYAQTGSFAATVHVRDREGRTADARTTVVVTRRPSPPRDPRPSPEPKPELRVTLTCTAKASPTPTPCNVTVSYDGATVRSSAVSNVDWDWGDGDSSSTSGPSESHSYLQGGTYTVFADVTANTKDGSKTAERQVTINVP